ncbi:MAG: hypothetical protein ACR2HR_05030 [Euzebya sp.]
MPESRDWDGGWAANEQAQRAAWSTTSAAYRLAWLGTALELALSSGALAKDRARRQREADALWARGPSA